MDEMIITGCKYYCKCCHNELYSEEDLSECPQCEEPTMYRVPPIEEDDKH